MIPGRALARFGLPAGAALLAIAAASAGEREGRADAPPARTELLVTTEADAGAGSLRAAILAAEANPGPDVVRFDPARFREPRTIRLETPLPEVTGELEIDGSIEDALWRASGAIVSGAGRLQPFRVAADGALTLRRLTVADGLAAEGGGVASRGRLVAHGVTFLDNRAERDGGAVANLGGEIAIVNSTFARNAAGGRGGAVALLGGRATVTHCTFSENRAEEGGALFNAAGLKLRNSILANSGSGGDCASEPPLEDEGARNLVEQGRGCGEPITTDDPRLEPLGYYNGPAMTFPVGGGSPAVNLGDNAAALDEDGEPLAWDQRGSGDPRVVAGFADLGAFEHQRHAHLVVDTAEDSPLRGCTDAGPSDCPLRGALEIANSTPEPDVIRFDPGVFGSPRTLELEHALPLVTAPLTLDAGGTRGLTIRSLGSFAPLAAAPGIPLRRIGISLEEPGSSSAPP